MKDLFTNYPQNKPSVLPVESPTVSGEGGAPPHIYRLMCESLCPLLVTSPESRTAVMETVPDKSG